MFQSALELPSLDTLSTGTEIKCLTETAFEDGEFHSKVGKATRTCRRLMKVRVYRNLNKPEFYSILAMEGEDKGKVVGYAKSVLLENCQFKVSEASRQRVLRDKQRNVHAFCQGVIVDASHTVQKLNGSECAVTYNPYIMGSFYRRSDNQPQTENCNQVLLQGSDVYITESA